MLVKQKVKYIQSLGQKKFREEERLFIAEGPKLVKDLIEADPSAIREIYALQSWIDENPVLLKQQDCIPVTEAELERISQLSTPNNVLALVEQYEIPGSIGAAGKITLVLDTIQDPGNLGTIIRIADWFGIHQIICSENSADLYNSKVVQSTMGSIARVHVFYTEIEAWLKKQGDIAIYATSLNGRDIQAMQKIKEGIIIIGNESKGISDSVMPLANQKITIGKKGKAESLNAAVAAGIVLSHLI